MKIQKSEISLLLVSVVVTVVMALLLIRWLQPSLLGISGDMILVKSSEEVVPYYEHIFRKEDIYSKEMLLKDPIIKIRPRQLYPDLVPWGPNDLLGFRNAAVPNNADIIIGDSLTYGNNAMMQDNWPHYLGGKLPTGVSVYSMASGGWGAAQYFYAFLKAPLFKPKVIVIAFYTGNDPLETFSLVYGMDIWHEFISDPELNNNDAPKVVFPAPENEKWAVTFSDGIKTIFTPMLRHASNKKHPAVDAGYQAMLNIARKMVTISQKEKIQVVFTILPTKELAYSRKIENEQMEVNPTYQALISDEEMRIKNFSGALKAIAGTIYVDVVTELQKEAMQSVVLYPSSDNGHPSREGYRVIGNTIAQAISPLFKSLMDGFYISVSSNEIQTSLLFVENGNYWIVEDPENLANIISPELVAKLKTRDLTGLNYKGHKGISEIQQANQP
jgi:lysophospholipase L1-like esterase